MSALADLPDERLAQVVITDLGERFPEVAAGRFGCFCRPWIAAHVEHLPTQPEDLARLNRAEQVGSIQTGEHASGTTTRLAR